MEGQTEPACCAWEKQEQVGLDRKREERLVRDGWGRGQGPITQAVVRVCLLFEEQEELVSGCTSSCCFMIAWQVLTILMIRDYSRSVI